MEILNEALDTSPLIMDQAMPNARPPMMKNIPMTTQIVGQCQPSSKCTPQPSTLLSGNRVNPSRRFGNCLRMSYFGVVFHVWLGVLK